MPVPDAAPADQVRRLRDDPGMAVLEGFHALKHALRFGAPVELALAADVDAVDALAAELAPDVRSEMRRLVRPAGRELIALAARRAPRAGVVAFARRPAVDLASVLGSSPDRPVVLLENPQDLANVGAVIRVAAAAGVAGVVTTGDRDPWDPQAIRGSAGLHFALPVARAAALPRGRPLVALDPGGEALAPQAVPCDAVLAFGTERHGLTAETLAAAAVRVRIPMREGVSSLNLATAVAVVIYAGRLAGTW